MRGQLGMREASSIDLSQDSRNELCLEHGLEATALRDAEELDQAVGGVFLFIASSPSGVLAGSRHRVP